MVEAVLRARRRKGTAPLALAAMRYAALGWPVCPGAQPASGQRAGSGQRTGGQWTGSQRTGGQRAAGQRAGGGAAQDQANGRACSCDRIGCPAPGAHPLSPAWKLQATDDQAVVGHWWAVLPRSNIVLATGRAFDVLDVPARAGLAALARLRQAAVSTGPVALSAADRALFFVASRAAVTDEDEWWSCHLDCVPEDVPAVTGLRWHCRDSYVLAPPSLLSSGLTARWVVKPGAAGTDPLPDALRLLEFLADACEEMAR